MSKPRWRWATRCKGGEQCRRLWRREPHLVTTETVIPQFPGYVGHWDDGAWSGQYSEGRDKAYFRKRFGRDLRPGEIRRLP